MYFLSRSGTLGSVVAIGFLATGFFAFLLLKKEKRSLEVQPSSRAEETGDSNEDLLSSTLRAAVRESVPAGTGHHMPPVPSEVAVSLPPRTLEEQWQEEFNGASSTALEEEANAINKFIHDETIEEFGRRFELGQADYMGQDRDVTITDEDVQRITAHRVTKDGVWRTVLPENEFPHLYEMQAKKLWLLEEARERSRNEK